MFSNRSIHSDGEIKPVDFEILPGIAIALLFDEKLNELLKNLHNFGESI